MNPLILIFLLVMCTVMIQMIWPIQFSGIDSEFDGIVMSSPPQICISVGGAGSDCDNLHRWQIAIYYDVCIYTLKIYI